MTNQTRSKTTSRNTLSCSEFGTRRAQSKNTHKKEEEEAEKAHIANCVEEKMKQNEMNTHWHQNMKWATVTQLLYTRIFL